jgi:hypothetical protein
MKSQVGLVILDVTSLDELDKSHVDHAAQITPSGRVLAAIFDLPTTWSRSYPWESEISTRILDQPIHRLADPDWQILSTIAVRCCAVRKNRREVTREIGVALFVKKGPKAYTRRGSAPVSVRQSSRLDTLHPVFTRDIANNVWHLSSVGALREIKTRLSSLLTWSDEKTLVLRNGKKTYVSHGVLDLDRSLIGVPTKTAYNWEHH